MIGLDLGNMRQLHCNATVMGINPWWLKLLFYFVDVGTKNALLIYKLLNNNESMNIANFKLILVRYCS